MTYHLLNPYDPADLDAASPAVALAAALTMGGNKFSVRCPNSGRLWPDGDDLDAWFVRETGLTARAFLEVWRADVAAALDSVRLTGARSSQAVDVAGRARFFARSLRASGTNSN